MLVICRASSTPGTRDWPFFVAWPQPLLFLGGWGQPPPASSAAAPTNTPHFLAVAFNRRPAPPCVSTMSPATSSTRPNTRRPARPRHHRGPMDQRHQGRRPKAAKERTRGFWAPTVQRAHRQCSGRYGDLIDGEGASGGARRPSSRPMMQRADSSLAWRSGLSLRVAVAGWV